MNIPTRRPCETPKTLLMYETSPQRVASYASCRRLRSLRLGYPFFFFFIIQRPSALMTPSLLSRLGHRVQRASVLEPLDLGLVEGVVQLDLEGQAILGVHGHRHRLANGKFCAGEVDLSRTG